VCVGGGGGRGVFHNGCKIAACVQTSSMMQQTVGRRVMVEACGRKEGGGFDRSGGEGRGVKISKGTWVMVVIGLG